MPTGLHFCIVHNLVLYFFYHSMKQNWFALLQVLVAHAWDWKLLSQIFLKRVLGYRLHKLSKQILLFIGSILAWVWTLLYGLRYEVNYNSINHLARIVDLSFYRHLLTAPAVLKAAPKLFLAPCPATALWPTPLHLSVLEVVHKLGTESPLGILSWYDWYA